MKRFVNIMKYLVNAILLVLVIFSVYTLISISVFKKPYVNIFGYTYFVIASGSMSGTIEVNDIIIVKLDEPYKEDDIITYASGDSFVTHRVISIEEDTLTTRGDANNTVDSNVPKKDVIGKVTTIISSISLLKLLGIIIVIFLVVSFINFESIFNKYIKHEKEKEKNPSPLEYTRAIPIINEDNAIIEEILSVTKKYNFAKFSIDDKVFEVKLKEDLDATAKQKIASVKNKAFIREILDVLKSNYKKSKITTEGALKLQYIYKLANTTIINPPKVVDIVDDITFDELFTYDFDDIGFTKEVRDKLYEMPIYVYLVIMIYAVVYNNEYYFDAVYKSLKFRVKIDRDYDFCENNYKVEKCIEYLVKIIEKCDEKESFKLDKILEDIKREKEKEEQD